MGGASEWGRVWTVTAAVGRVTAKGWWLEGCTSFVGVGMYLLGGVRISVSGCCCGPAERKRNRVGRREEAQSCGPPTRSC